MNIPQANYIEDKNGNKTLVQLELKDWERFVEEFEQLKNAMAMKSDLKDAFREMRQIKRGEKKGTTLDDFLNEL